MKLGYRQGIISALLFGVMLMVLVSLDDRVRERFSAMIAGSHDVTPWGDRVVDFGGALVGAVRYQSIEGAPLLVFAAVSAVLVVFMLRT